MGLLSGRPWLGGSKNPSIAGCNDKRSSLVARQRVFRPVFQIQGERFLGTREIHHHHGLLVTPGPNVAAYAFARTERLANPAIVLRIPVVLMAGAIGEQVEEIVYGQRKTKRPAPRGGIVR